MMKRIVLIILVCMFFSGCAFESSRISGSFAPEVRNYGHFEKRWSVKTTPYECDFKRISQGLTEGEPFCKVPVNADYISFFASFIYYSSGITPDIYMANLAREIQLAGAPHEKMFIESLAETPSSLFKDFKFKKLEPTSFVVQSGGETAVYLSSTDIFLRDRIFPTFRVTGLKVPKDKEPQYLSDYMLQYAILPQVLQTNYSTDWLSHLIGVPLYSQAEKLFEAGRKEDVLNYFKTIENLKVSASPYASPFVFGGEQANTAPLYGLKPAVPQDGYGYFNEYLPSYRLIKIDIMYRDKNGDKTTIKTYAREDIDKLLKSQNKNGGFYTHAKLPQGASVIIRFTHDAMPPRYKEIIPQYSESAGLAYIYSSIGYSVVTELNATNSYDIAKLPYDCIVKADIVKFLETSGISKKETATYTGKYSDKLSECTGSEENMTRVIFSHDFDTKYLIK